MKAIKNVNSIPYLSTLYFSLMFNTIFIEAYNIVNLYNIGIPSPLRIRMKQQQFGITRSRVSISVAATHNDSTATATASSRTSNKRNILNTRKRMDSQPKKQTKAKAQNTSCKNHIQVLNTLSKQGTKESASIAYGILKSLESSSSSATDSKTLNVVHYALVINAFANIGDDQHAKQILDTLIANCTNTSDNTKDKHAMIIPNSHCFSGVLKAYINKAAMLNRKEDGSDSRSVQSNNNKVSLKIMSLLGVKCEELINQMCVLYKILGNDGIKPNTVIYNLLLKAYAEIASYISSKQQHQQQQHNQTGAYQSSKNKTYKDEQLQVIIDKAIDLLSQMENGSLNKVGLKLPPPDSYTYCTIISLLAKSVHDVKAAELAESYLEKTTPNDTASYNAVLLLWSKIGTCYAADRATSLLQKLEAIGKPNITSYNTVISAWTKSKSDGDVYFAAEKAEEILQRIEEKNQHLQPNVIAYSSIIDCWSRSGSIYGAKRAQKLLDHMEHLYSTGRNKLVQPNVITYTSVMTAYGRTNTVEGAKSAHELLDRMNQRYLESNHDESTKPNIVSYFAVIDGWAKSTSPDAGVQAESLLTTLENLNLKGDKAMRPDVRVYARVIAAHVKCGQKKNLVNAEKIIHRMEKFASTGNVCHAAAKPNIVIYNTLINEYARRRLSKDAMRILNQIDRFNSSMTTESDRVRADEHTLNGIIYALSVGNGIGYARKSLKILERLENSHINEAWDVKPSTRSYNMVINACANSWKGNEKEKSEAFSIALNVYAKLIASNHADVDRFTYISLFKVCGKLLKADSEIRQKFVMEFFMSCCNEGLVDGDVLSNFLLSAKSFELPEPLSNLNAKMLPSDWTYRAREKHSKR